MNNALTAPKAPPTNSCVIFTAKQRYFRDYSQHIGFGVSGRVQCIITFYTVYCRFFDLMKTCKKFV